MKVDLNLAIYREGTDVLRMMVDLRDPAKPLVTIKLSRSNVEQLLAKLDNPGVNRGVFRGNIVSIEVEEDAQHY